MDLSLQLLPTTAKSLELYDTLFIFPEKRLKSPSDPADIEAWVPSSGPLVSFPYTYYIILEESS